MHLRDGYKISEIGVIPTEWEVNPSEQIFSTITDFVANGSFASLADNVDYKSEEDFAVLIRLTDYKAKYKGPFLYITQKAYEFLNKSVLESGDLIIANVGANAGYIFRAPNWNKPMSLGPNAILVKTNQNSEFYYYWIASEIGQESIKKIISTTAQPKFNKTDFRKMPLPLPPFPEQQKIADILSTVDEHISETESLIEKTKVLKQGMMQLLLTKGIGHTEFKDTEIGRIPVEWEVQHVSDSYDVNKKSLPNTTHGETEINYIDIESVTKGKISGFKKMKFSDAPSRARRVVVCGDVIISTVRPYLLGFAQINSEIDNLICSTGFAVLTSKNNRCALNNYIAQVVFSDLFVNQLKDKMVGSNYPAVNSSDIKDVLISLPPILEQHKIAAILSSIDDQIDSYQTKLAAITQLKSALMQQLLTGKTRVKI